MIVKKLRFLIPPRGSNYEVVEPIRFHIECYESSLTILFDGMNLKKNTVFVRTKTGELNVL